jgi:glycosyltransferase involved in cell wall biosynthesis
MAVMSTPDLHHAAQQTAAPTVQVIFPVRDEAEALPWLLERLPDGVSAIVVDNGSSDGSGDIAAAHGALVVREDIPGFGSACYRGLITATADLVCFCDGDGSLDPADLLAVIEPVRRGDVDLMLAARRPEPGAMTWHQRVANRVLAFEIRRRSKVPFTDLGPMRCARRTALLELDLRDRRSGWPLEMVLRAHQAGWRIGETSVPYRPRKGGRSKVTGTVKGTLRAVQDMGRLLTETQRRQ